MTATFLPVRWLGGSGTTHSLSQPLFNDRAFDIFNRDRRIVDPQHAGAFAGSGTNAPGEFGEVVGFVQAIEGLFPQAAIDQIVKFGNQIVDGTTAGHAADQGAGVAKGNAAVHAACALGPEFVLGHVLVDFVPVLDAIAGGAISGQLSDVFNKASWFSHRSLEVKRGWTEWRAVMGRLNLGDLSHRVR